MTKPEPTTKPSRDYRKHGLTRLLRSRMRQLDGRSALSQSIAKYRAELLSSLGGADSLSAQENTLVEMCSRDWLMLQHIDAYLFQTGIFNKKRRQAYALTVQRMQVADSLTRRLQALGLQRRAKQLPSLSDYLATSKPTPTNGKPVPSGVSSPVPDVSESSDGIPEVQEVQQATHTSEATT
jgi:hypothetical protein